MQEKNGDIGGKTSLKCQQISNNYYAIQIGVCTSERKLDASDVNLHPLFLEIMGRTIGPQMNRGLKKTCIINRNLLSDNFGSCI